MSKIQEFIDAWNSEVDTKIAETQIKLDKYLVARKSAIALSEPLILKMPTLKTSTSGSFTIPGFDVTTLGQLVDWSYPIDGNPIVDEFGNRKEKSAVVRIYSRFKITDTSLYTDGYTYGTMSYLAQQYKTAIKVSDDDLITGTTGVDDLVILEENSNEFNNLESYKKLKSLGGKAWFDFWMHSLYSVIFDTKISVSKLKPSEYSELFMTIEDILHDRYLKGYYYQGARFRFDGFDASSEKSKYFKAILEAGDNFFTSQISGTQSGTQSGDYILSVINPLSDAEKKISGKITFIETGSYIIPNSTLSGLPNPWKNPKTNTEVPNNTGIITFNGGKSKSDKKSLADEAVIGLQNIIEGTYGLIIYLKYQESDTAPVVPPSDAPTGSTASAITGASESSVPDPTPNTTISTQEFTFNVEQLDIFSNADFGNLFIIGQEDETLLYDDGTETYGSEYIEDQFLGEDEISIEVLESLPRSTGLPLDSSDTPNQPSNSVTPVKVNIPGDSWYAVAASFISTMEGFLSRAKYDVDHYRGGYGTSQKLVGSNLIEVTATTTFTKQEAIDTLSYQLKSQYEKVMISSFGSGPWGKLNKNQKAAIVSLAYNCGSGIYTKAGVKVRKYATLVKQGVLEGNASLISKGIASGPTTGGGKVYAALITRRAKEAGLAIS